MMSKVCSENVELSAFCSKECRLMVCVGRQLPATAAPQTDHHVDSPKIIWLWSLRNKLQSKVSSFLPFLVTRIVLVEYLVKGIVITCKYRAVNDSVAMNWWMRTLDYTKDYSCLERWKNEWDPNAAIRIERQGRASLRRHTRLTGKTYAKTIVSILLGCWYMGRCTCRPACWKKAANSVCQTW